MKIQHNKSLKKYNTFGIEALASHFVEITTIQNLQEALQLEDYPKKIVLSGGSNMLITNDLNALVMHINIKGITIISEDENHVVLKIMAGENWHELVIWTINQDYGGLENLSLIPGNVGTSPIQNIGAYGVELKDSFESCEAMDVSTQQLITFSKSDCQFGYRDSIFKNAGKGKYIITSVNLKLNKPPHSPNTSYGAIETELKENKIDHPTIKDVSDAVIAIRQKKLPDPIKLGNSGSFFKNPVITKEKFITFLDSNPDAPFYQISETSYKIPAGWLIEKCGFKGKRFGDAGVHKNQALVLVNYGGASGQELLLLAHKIQDAVLTRYGIKIIPEVNIIS
ncbi:UDP-N-acetylmuramate dehydrogenase [uncultured Eudoraea sp.]|uniref:UDP-N-acetylmuramate dehydrogenase n=1 Tax=uncultured Eudoraea sp. TaxID=1035614 RepID=UPI00263539E2|nr:UDP-N-acetylmuramate dehydrogenase [uncultured Eudoraea sp.]